MRCERTRPRPVVVLAALAGGLASLAPAGAAASASATGKAALLTSTLLDGRGAALAGKTVLIEGGRIGAVLDAPPSGVPQWDLRGLTVLPGLIDTHVHLSSYFGPDGKMNSPGQGPDRVALATLANAQAALRAGFTTLQCLAVGDVDQYAERVVRDAIERLGIPGPRLLLSGAPILRPESPERLREVVRARAAQGVDVVKVFASGSIRDGGCATLSAAQLEAICGEANRIGIRTAVHAHDDESVLRATLAGCGAIEHGTGASVETLAIMAASGTAYDPNIGLVIQNYLEHRDVFAGVGNFRTGSFELMEDALPGYIEFFRRALTVKGLELVMGTDAVAGAHGRNAEELVVRVRDGGQDAMDAVVSATSRSARVLGLDATVGSIAPGYEADVIALDGDPRLDPTAFLRVVFVMRGGEVVVASPRKVDSSSEVEAGRAPAPGDATASGR